MRLLTTLITMLITICPTASAQTLNESVRFDEKIYDFGTIGETDGKVTHRFVFTNTGRDTVTLCAHARDAAACMPKYLAARCSRGAPDMST